MGSANGITLNKASGKTSQHVVNATNAITSLENPNPGEPTKVFEDTFGSLSSVWLQNKGTWSVSSGVLNVDTLTGSPSEAVAVVTKTVADDGVTERERGPSSK